MLIQLKYQQEFDNKEFLFLAPAEIWAAELVDKFLGSLNSTIYPTRNSIQFN